MDMSSSIQAAQPVAVTVDLYQNPVSTQTSDGSADGTKDESTNFLVVRSSSSQSVQGDSGRTSGGSSPLSRHGSNISRTERTRSRTGEGMESRVILRMEVDSTVHSHLIGTSGETIGQLRTETSCNVNFPAGNRTGSPDGGPGFPHLHENEVSIRGKLTNVVTACGKLRSMTPFHFCFVTGGDGFGSGLTDQRPSHIKGFQNVFDMDIGMTTTPNGTTMIHIRGPQSSRTLLGASGVCEQLRVGPEDIVVTQTIRIHPHSQSLMMTLCDAANWMERLSAVTKTKIKFPDGRGRGAQDRQSVTITGSVNGVAAAWIILMSMLPVTLRVFVNDVIDYTEIEKYATDILHVNFLAPRRDPRPEDRQYVEFRSYERNMDNICEAYHALLGQTVPASSLPNLSKKLTDLGLGFALPAIEERLHSLAELPSSPPPRMPSVSQPFHYPPMPFMPPPFGFMPMPAPMYYPVPAPFFVPVPAPVPSMIPHHLRGASRRGSHHKESPSRNGSSRSNGTCPLGPDCTSCKLVKNCAWLSNGALDKLKHSLENGHQGKNGTRPRGWEVIHDFGRRERSGAYDPFMRELHGSSMYPHPSDSFDWMEGHESFSAMDHDPKPVSAWVTKDPDYYTSMEGMFLEMSRSGLPNDSDMGIWSNGRNSPESSHTDWGEWNFEGKPANMAEVFTELNPEDFPTIGHWN